MQICLALSLLILQLDKSIDKGSDPRVVIQVSSIIGQQINELFLLR